MASVTQLPSGIPVVTVSRLHHKSVKLWKSHNLLSRRNIPCFSSNRRAICYANTSPWEPAPITYAPENEGTLLKETSNIFETMNSSAEPAEASITKTKQNVDATNQPFQYLRRPLWLLGPALLLVTGVVPTLWLPISSIFLGPSIASLLSLTGLDCIFNLGASLFSAHIRCYCSSKQQYPTLQQQTACQLSVLEHGSKFLLGPYILLLSVQMLTEMLTWHWQSPVWLVTPVVYEAYRLLQLMRGLKLGPELGAPSWMVHAIRGLVCFWVLVLGVQLMRVAWYAGFTARSYQKPSSASADDLVE
ncbi:hypothetical protein Sango_2739500 [Sesamum angolense]|uniref:Uncharacterized protein n=1 Tax=Sesamum angolense TaxID=2727404 RepID=A0AAE1T9Y7_9LAMI|nr:hypothetical protein Sango_2739500 [Sesamum angolense]